MSCTMHISTGVANVHDSTSKKDTSLEVADKLQSKSGAVHAAFGPEGLKVRLHNEAETHEDLALEIADMLKEQESDDPFSLLDVGEAVRRVDEWRQQLPRVKPFYAVKCNDDPVLLRVLSRLGLGFDCASKKEIEDVLAINGDPSRIVFAHPVKYVTHLQYADRVQAHLMTFDNEDELHKIKAHCPSARLLLRILPPSEGFDVEHDLGNKFGCHPLDAAALLLAARTLGLHVVGVSFHVGCGKKKLEVYAEAVRTAAKVFHEAEVLGFDLHVLDIGGGFPAEVPLFRKAASIMKGALDLHFPPDRRVTLLAEPGRYIAEATTSLTVKVLGKRRVSQHLLKRNESMNGNAGGDDDLRRERFAYYVNDGLYGPFRDVGLYDKAQPPFLPRLLRPPRSTDQHASAVYGPTCDGLDQILWGVALPELHVGDVLNFPAMGAYTLCFKSNFNGMPAARRFYHSPRSVWTRLFENVVRG